jgi:hypothetical protein
MTKNIKEIDFKHHVLPVLGRSMGGTGKTAKAKITTTIDVNHPIFDEHDILDGLFDLFQRASQQSKMVQVRGD